MLKGILFFCFLFIAILSKASVIYVNWNATGSNNGSSWVNAYNSFQAGINAASAGDQVWVCQGSYTPGQFSSFNLKEGVEVYGGFLGTETLLSQRDWKLNQTDLTGSQSNPWLPRTRIILANYSDGLTNAAILDGFRFTNADIFIEMYHVYPTIRNCHFDEISAGVGEVYQVGIFQSAGVPSLGTTIIDGCRFTSTQVRPLWIRSNTHVTNSIIEHREAYGSLACGDRTNSIKLSENTPGYWTPTLQVLFKNTSIFNCSIELYRYRIAGSGAAASPAREINLSLEEVTLYGLGTQIYGQSSYPPLIGDFSQAYLNFKNTTIRNAYDYWGSPVVNVNPNSTITGTYNDADPHVRFLNGDMSFMASSSSLNNGNNTGVYALDLAGNTRIFNTTVDRGSYEYQNTTLAPLTAPTAVSGNVGTTSYVNVTASGGSGGTYVWYDMYGNQVGTGPTVNIIAYGVPPVGAVVGKIYFVRMENGDQVSDFYTFDARVNTPLSVTPSSSICLGDSKILVATGGSTEYQWYTGSCGGTLIASGNDSIIVSPTTNTTYYVGNGLSPCKCLSTSILVLPRPANSTAASPYTICQGQSASISATVPSGAGVEWFDNSTGTPPSLSSSNPYVVSPSSTITYYAFSSNGVCKSASGAPVVVNVLPTPSNLTGSNSYSVCSGQSVSLSVSNVTGGSTVEWYTNAAGTGLPAYTGNPINITPSSAITYYVFANNGSCKSANPLSVTIAVAPIPSDPTGASPYTICQGDTQAMPISLPVGSSVEWYDNAAGTGTVLSTTNPYLVWPNSTMTYYAFSSNSGCKSASALPVTVNVQAVPPVLSTDPATICQGQNYSLSITGVPSGISVEWFADSLANTPLYTGNPYVVSPSVTTTYWVFGNNGTCLSNTGTFVTITVDSIPVNPTGASQDSICLGELVSLSAVLPSGATIQWYDNATGTPPVLSTSNPWVISPTSDASFYAFTLDGNCRSIGGLQVDVEVVEIPVTPSGLTSYAICSGDSVSVQVNLPVGADVDWYAQADGSGGVVSTANPWIIYPTSDTAFYAWSTNGYCVSQDSLRVDVSFQQRPDAPNGDSLYTVCEGSLLNLLVNLNVGSTVEWYNNPLGTGTPLSTQNPLPLNAISDTVLYAFSSTLGCLSTDSMKVEVFALAIPEDLTGNNMYDVCKGDEVSMIFNSGPSNNTQWYDNPQGTGIPVYIGDTLVLTPPSDTLYYVFLSNGICSSVNPLNVQVSVHSLPDISIEYQDSICESQPLVITSVTNSGVGVLWSTGQTTSSISVDANGIPDTIWVQTQNIYGCQDAALLSNINPIIFQNPLASFDTLSAVYAPGTVPFIDSSSSDVVAWHWSFGDGDTSSLQNPVHAYEQAGNYSVELIVMNRFGCLDTHYLNMIVKEQAIIPNVFSPNADGYNDLFIISTLGIKDPHLHIKNRWGSTLYEAEGRNLYWDGRTNAGSPVSEGTYYYILYGVEQLSPVSTGYITLLR